MLATRGEAKYGTVRKGRSHKENSVRSRVLEMISRIQMGEMQEPSGGASEEEVHHFKALTLTTTSTSRSSNDQGYQAKETDSRERRQFPLPLFPTTLASYVVVFDMDDEWIILQSQPNLQPPPKSYAKITAQPLIDKMRSADMIVREFPFPAMKKYFALISISEKRQKMVAELMGPLIKLRFKKNDDEGNEVKNGGGWCAFKQHLSPLYERCSEGTLFSSCQQCQIIEFLLNDVNERALGPQLIQKDACEPGNTPLMQLKKDEKISDYFYLHHEHKKKWMQKYWSESYYKRQPIEDVREYFGEEIALYFTWMGYLLTMMWIPAFTGIFVFVMGAVAFAQSGTFDSPYVPLFCIFISIWAVMFMSGWKQLELTYEHEWDTVEYLEPSDDRTEFVQNKRTYKRFNDLSKKEEYYPDPLWRWIAIITSCAVVPTLMLVQVSISISLDLVEASIAGPLGGKYGAGAYIGAVLQGLFIVGIMHFFDIFVTRWLTSFENWQTDREHLDARIVKYTFFSDVALTFSIYFWAFISNKAAISGVDLSCPGQVCYDYLMIKVPILIVTIKLARQFLLPLLAPLDRRLDVFFQNLFQDYIGAFQKLFEFKPAPAAAPAPDGAGPDGREAGDRPACDVESQLDKFEAWDLCRWYLTKIMDLTWLTLFSGAFPLLPLGFLILQMVELRQHAGQLLTRNQRLRYRCVKDLGIFDELQEVVVLMSIFTQCCVLAFASNGLLYYFPDLPDSKRAFYAVALEHLLLLFKVLWDSGTDVPEEARKAHKRRRYERSILIKELDHLDETKDVVFYTSDDGEAFYGKKA